ncbi:MULTISPECIES: hypothetical protein [unclassified Streptomyces]|uniref:hypothetical protein n=1 Tax=unclassified Streptomyces TaxID=2593676 RepID=UPI0033FB973B
MAAWKQVCHRRPDSDVAERARTDWPRPGPADCPGLGLSQIEVRVQHARDLGEPVGAFLVFVAFQLASQSRDQLIGEAADPVLRSEIHEFLDERGEIDTVSTLLTMRLGPAPHIARDMTINEEDQLSQQVRVRQR